MVYHTLKKNFFLLLNYYLTGVKYYFGLPEAIRRIVMSIMESLPIALFCILIVFAFLAAFYLLVKLSTNIIKHISAKSNK